MLFYSSRIPYISLKKIMYQVFFPSLYHRYWNQTWCNEIMELPVCVQKKIDFFCTKITFLHFWYIFNYLYSTTVLHFMCSVYADQFSSVLLNLFLYFVCQLTKHQYCVFQLRSILLLFFLLFLFDWLVLPQWISFQSITFFLLILSSPPPLSFSRYLTSIYFQYLY